MKDFLKKLDTGWVRLLAYLIFIAGGVWYSGLKNLPVAYARIEAHETKLAILDEKTNSVENSLDKIESRTDDIYKILLQMRGR